MAWVQIWSKMLLFQFQSAIVLALIFFLVRASSLNANATNSTARISIKTIKNNPSTAKRISVASVNLNVTSKIIDFSKKDKRQAQRGYTDVPNEERPFNDIHASPSQSPVSEFGSNFPLTKKEGISVSSNFLPDFDKRPESSFFAPRLEYPQTPPNHGNYPIAGNAVQERRDDVFDSSTGDGKAIPGEANRDYPIYSSIPRTSFSCKNQQWPGYYADTEARCQVFWICQKNRMDAFLCPNGTLFNQQVFVCDWWFNVDCTAATGYYSRNQFLYAGPGVGIDGSPARFRGSSVAAAATPNILTSESQRPNNILPLNSGVNQVQSSNQISRVASVDFNPHKQQTSTVPSYDGNQNQNYLDSQSQRQQSQQQFVTSIPNSNQIQPTEKFSSSQTILANRMHKNFPSQTTSQPFYNGENSFTGEYQQPSYDNQQQSQSDPERRTFSSIPLQNQLSAEYSLNGSSVNVPIYSTQRPQPKVTSIKTLSKTVPASSQHINVNIEPKGGDQGVFSFSGTISSTARPTATAVPVHNQGSSTLHTPRESFTIHNVAGYQSNNEPVTTVAPITTTFRSTSTTYTSNLGFAYVPQSQQSSPEPQPSNYPTPNPNNVVNRQIGSVGNVQPTYTNVPTTTLRPPAINGFVSTGFSSTPETPSSQTEGYVDRFGFVSSTPVPKNFGSPDNDGHLGMRSNQYTNDNGQREIMYSSSNIDANIEFPYSPSQQKNKQRLLELEALKGIQNKELFLYPHYHGQRSNPFDEIDKFHHKSKGLKRINQRQGFQGAVHQQAVGHQNLTVAFQQHLEVSTPHSYSSKHFGNLQQPTQQYLMQPNQYESSQHSLQHPPIPNHQELPQNQPLFNQPVPQQQVNPSYQQNQQHNQRPQTYSTLPQSLQNQIEQHQQPTFSFSSTTPTPTPNPFDQKDFPQQQQRAFPEAQTRNVAHQGSFQSTPYLPQPNHQLISHRQGTQPQQQQLASTTSGPREYFQIQSQQPQQKISPTNGIPFHEKLVQIPASNIQVPPSSPESPYSPLGTRDGYAALKSGSFISIATTDSPFSKKIIKESSPLRNDNLGEFHPFAAVTPVPNGLFPQSSTQTNTLRPPHIIQSPSTTPQTFTPFLLHPSSNLPSSTPFTTQNVYIPAPTQSPLTSTSPGHRQNPYLPHPNGKKKGRQQQEGIQYPNAMITTTIKYPEGTGSLRLGVAGSTKRLVDFSYQAHSKTTTKPKPSHNSNSNPFPPVTERFDNIIVTTVSSSSSSTTKRPKAISPHPPSSSPNLPQYKGNVPKKGARLAGAVKTKSTSSTSAIYVDTAVTAESSVTPVSIAPSATATPAVSTSNYGLRMSTMAKKRMAAAWQSYFSGSEKDKHQAKKS